MFNKVLSKEVFFVEKETKYTEALEYLAYIKSITDHKKRYGKQTAPYLLIWGCVWLIGYGVNYFNLSSLGYWSWISLSVLGWIGTIVVLFKQGSDEQLPNYIKEQTKYISASFIGIFLMFAFLINTGLLEYSQYLLGFYTVLLVSIMYILLGVLIGKEVFLIGIWLGVLSIATYTWFPEFMNPIFALLGGGSMIVSGAILIKRG